MDEVEDDVRAASAGLLEDAGGGVRVAEQCHVRAVAGGVVDLGLVGVQGDDAGPGRGGEDLQPDVAETAEAGDLVAGLRGEVAARWNLPALHQAVLESQRRRRLVDAALMTGVTKPWDYQPFRDATKQYMRNTMDLDDLEAMARFPPRRPGKRRGGALTGSAALSLRPCRPCTCA